MTTSMEKLERDNREHVMKLIDIKKKDIAKRDKLDLNNPQDDVIACTKALNEDPVLRDLYRPNYSVPVREVSLTD